MEKIIAFLKTRLRLSNVQHYHLNSHQRTNEILFIKPKSIQVESLLTPMREFSTHLLNGVKEKISPYVEQGDEDGFASLENATHLDFPTVKEIEKQISQQGDRITQRESQERSTIENRIANIKEMSTNALSLENLRESLGDKKHEKLVEAKHLKNSSLDKPILIETEIASLREDSSQLTEELEVTKNRLFKLVKIKYQGLAPVRGWLSPTRFYILLIAISCIEVIANKGAFTSLGIGTNLTSWIFASLVACGQALFGKLFGSSLVNEQISKKRLYGFTTLLFCALMSWTRVISAELLLIKLVFIAANITLAVFTILLGRRFARDDEYFEIKTESLRLRTEITSKQNAITQLEENYSDRCKIISLKFDKETKAFHESNEAFLKASLAQYEEDLKTLEYLSKEFQKQLKELKTIELGRYWILVNKGRRQKGLKPLVNGNQGGLNLAVWVGLLGFSLMVGCSYPQLEDSNIALSYDQSEKTTSIDIEPIMTDILEKLQLDTIKGHNGAISIRLMPISHLRVETAYELSLEASPTDYWAFNEKVMTQKAKEFTKQLRQNLMMLTTPSDEMEASFFYLRMVDQLNWLSTKQGKRYLITYSDLLENQGSIKFHSYKNTPKKLNADKEILLRKLTENYPLSDSINGIKWVNHHLPNAGTEDALHYEAIKVFGEHFSQNGIETDFKASRIAKARSPVRNSKKDEP